MYQRDWCTSLKPAKFLKALGSYNTYIFLFSATQEAVGSMDPDILTTVIQHREYQHLTKKSGGMVEILDELEKV